MHDFERPTDIHDSLVELLRRMDLRPLTRLICSKSGIELDRDITIRERSPTIAVPSLSGKRRKRIADVAFTVHGEDGRVLAVLVLEVQLSWDRRKRWIWGLLAVAFAADEECPTRVAVVTPDPELREKIRTQVLPEIEPQPLLIEPDGIPMIDDAERARRQPRETIFAALYHVAHTREPLEARVAGIRAALIANRTLDDDERLRYGELMLAMTPSEIMQRALEALEEDDEFDEPNKLDPANLPAIFRNGCLFVTGREEGLVQGREEGLVQGREEGLVQGQLGALREVLVDILAARGVEMDESIHTRIHQCQHAPTLARWCAAASSVAAGSLQALLDE